MRHKIPSLSIGLSLSACSILAEDKLPKDEKKPILNKWAEYCRRFLINL